MKKSFFLSVLLALTSLTYSQTTSIQARVFLQGAYLVNDSMSSLINSAGYLPLSQPYNVTPWNYTGTEVLSTIPANMVDWVLLELRDAQNTSIGYRAALLLNDGSIVDTNLSSNVVFDGIADGDYFLLIDHRNHLPVMSARAIHTPSAIPYDFSDTLNFPAIGGHLGQKELEAGVFGLIAGDVNKDGVVKYSGVGNDRSRIIQRIIGETGSTSITTTTGGYFAEDLSMDGIVKYAGAGNDPAKIIQTLIGMTGSTAITATYSTPPLLPPATPQVFSCGDSLTDPRDGQKYATVQIGTQCWMAQNLNVGTMINGNSHQTDNSSIEKYCYDNVLSNCDAFGGLYQWDEMMDYAMIAGADGICPPNGEWHIPTDNEWCILTSFLDTAIDCNIYGASGIDAGGKMKATGLAHWDSPNTGATNSSGFNALGVGYLEHNMGFFNLLKYTHFWASEEYSGNEGISRRLYYENQLVNRRHQEKTFGFSVRCIHDSTFSCVPQPDQADAGSDSLGIVGDSVQLWANQSSVGSGQWAVVSGTSTSSVPGSFSDSTAADAWFYGQPGVVYELVWMIYTVCDTTYDTVLVSFAHSQTFSQCGDTLIDTRDGKKYPTVHIGTQCWMTANLNVGEFISSNYTNNSNHSDVSDNGIIEKYCYNNDESLCDIYGGLYDWEEAMDYTFLEGSRGVCPENWHLPGDDEWVGLEGAVDSVYDAFDAEWNANGWRGYNAGGQMKETGTIHWSAPNTGANGSYGFNGLPGGHRAVFGNFSTLSQNAYYWSSSSSSSYVATFRSLLNSSKQIRKASEYRTFGFSIRCVLDSILPCIPQPDQANAGPDSLGIVGDSVQLWANQSSMGSGQWAVVSGTSTSSVPGSFSDSTAADAWFYGVPGETYELVWTISTQCGSTSDTVTISFTEAPWQCGDSFLDPRDQQVYPTVQIGDYCWFATNLNYGSRVEVSVNMTDNGIAEKHCYNDDTSYCDTYGGLYQWDEAMQYESLMGAPGLCPDGWHISTDAEWKNLEGTADSQYGVGDSIWDIATWRGFDVGKNLKATSSWANNGNGTDIYGFSALATGRTYNGVSGSMGSMTYIWVALEYDTQRGWSRYIRSDYDNIRRGYFYKTDGRSVRCVMNDSICSPQPEQANAGPDSLGIAGDSIQLWANQSSVGNGQWSVVSGSGAVLSDAEVADSWFYGVPGETYELVWSITTYCGSNSDTVVIGFAPLPPMMCGDTLVDLRDGQAYRTVQIGYQCWMAENLNVGTMINGDLDQTNNSILEKYCYDNDPNSCSEYGGLYHWDEAMNHSTVEGSIGICPAGWHLPADAEWCSLTTYLDSTVDCTTFGWSGTDAGSKMKEAGTNHWINGGYSTNSSNYTALGAGYCTTTSGFFHNLKYNAYFWSSSTSFLSDGIGWWLAVNKPNIGRSATDNAYGYSVRCIADTFIACTPHPEQAQAGPDSLNIIGDSIQLSANTPTVGSGQWTVASSSFGNPGVFSDSTAADSWFYGIINETYALVWTITTKCGSSSDTVLVSFSAASTTFMCGDSLLDTRDGRKYATVEIGTQCWMAENLNVGTMVNGSSDQTNNSILEKYCYDNDLNNCKELGGLYQWYEAMDYVTLAGTQGICPAGWHLPANEEWCTMTNFIDTTVDCSYIWGYSGTDAGGKMKETGYSHWDSPNTGATNSSGFTALAAGARLNDGNFYMRRLYAYFWTSSEYTSTNSFGRELHHLRSNVYRSPHGNIEGLSVRCIADAFIPCTPQPGQANAGPDSLGIVGDSVQLYANTPLVGSGRWSVASASLGNQGTFSDSTAADAWFYGAAGDTFELVWTISTQCGSNSDTIIIGFDGSQTLHMLSHSISQDIVVGTVSCYDNATGYTAENHFIRVFNPLSEFNISGSFYITNIEFGIENAASGTGSGQPANVDLYILNGAMNFDSLSLIGHANTIIPDTSSGHLMVPVSAMVAHGQTLVVDIHIPDGRTTQNTFFMGSNGLGETAPSYIASSDCSVPDPVTYASIGSGSVHLIINVYGYVFEK